MIGMATQPARWNECAVMLLLQKSVATAHSEDKLQDSVGIKPPKLTD